MISSTSVNPICSYWPHLLANAVAQRHRFQRQHHRQTASTSKRMRQFNISYCFLSATRLSDCSTASNLSKIHSSTFNAPPSLLRRVFQLMRTMEHFHFLGLTASNTMWYTAFSSFGNSHCLISERSAAIRYTYRVEEPYVIQ